jgi:hypothetical protein
VSTTCAICSKPTKPLDTQTLFRVVGWERRALASSSRRGGSDVTQRERTGEVAHARCVEQQARGISPDQGSLV